MVLSHKKPQKLERVKNIQDMFPVQRIIIVEKTEIDLKNPQIFRN